MRYQELGGEGDVRTKLHVFAITEKTIVNKLDKNILEIY